jgi:hypothetical protein
MMEVLPVHGSYIADIMTAVNITATYVAGEEAGRFTSERVDF